MWFLLVIIELNMIIKYPKTLIIGTSELVATYQTDTMGLISSDDLPEIMAQVLHRLINYETTNTNQYTYDEYYRDVFPDYQKLRHADFLIDVESTAIVEKATNELFNNVRNKLLSLNAYVNKDFPYFFYKFLGKDIVLDHLPF